ncbi:hypothetical protein V6N11_029204 [Hibiscus sabdariffa]|uniref:GAG-pre-integrase domain-containing protein n=1 Tax=Hibiscus sabdariffa TaxID=183260 RepID=A0ABR1ZU21_9ROSI
MGNQETSKIVGIGNVILKKTNTYCEIVLKDVRHVPNMHLNLISVGKLDDVGYMNLFGGGKWKLTRNNMIVARGNKQGSLYVTQGKLCKGEANVACGNSCLELWHKSLRHISEKGLQILAQKTLIPEAIANTKQSGSPVSKVITQIIQDPVPVIRPKLLKNKMLKIKMKIMIHQQMSHIHKQMKINLLRQLNQKLHQNQNLHLNRN